MMPVPFAVAYYLHLPILIVLVSLVYSATRYDDLNAILQEALRWGMRLGGFLFGIMLLLFLILRYF